MSEKQQLIIQKKIVEYDNIIYCLNEEENSADIIDCKKNLSGIIIPGTIKNESKEYNVKRILNNSFQGSKIKYVIFTADSQLQTIGKKAFSYSQIESIKIPSSVTLIGESSFLCCDRLLQIEFGDDSKLQTIEKKAFSFSTIESLTIPPELVELKEEWCRDTSDLTEIAVSPRNPRYCCYEDKMIIGKTNIEQKYYDNLVFCVRDIQYVKIPSYIEHICSYSFEDCGLSEIEFENDSNLRTIDKNAFFSASIESLTIPSKLIELKEGWCSSLDLMEIAVSPENPRYCCYEDKMIIGKTNIEQKNYDCLVFCVRDIEYVKIPSFIEHICSYSFEKCLKLKRIEFENDSKLRTIDKYAFSSTSIESIKIPSSVTIIGEYAFYIKSNAVNWCKPLKRIEFEKDSKLRTIEKNAFYSTSIESLTIPSELVELNEGWCFYMPKLTKIAVSPGNPRYCCIDEKMIIGKTNIEQDNYDCLVFCVRDIKHIKIPSFIEHIGSYSFEHCEQLEDIEIPSDSILQTIDKYAFYISKIKSIKIPSSVSLIGENAFMCCNKLKVIEISDNSKLKTIDKYAFYSSAIENITIPSSVTLIGKKAFTECKQLQRIEISNDSKLQTIDKYAFSCSAIQSIKIPSSVRFIGKYAFMNCNLKIIEIDNLQIISIDQTAFKYCKKTLFMIPVHSPI